jgi:hypothetical protein
MLATVYIAAPYSMKESAKQLRNVLHVNQIHCTSRWIDLDDDFNDELKGAQMDLADVRAAQALVLINYSEWANKGSGGRHVEMGIAIERGMLVFVLGKRSNVFHHLPQVICCPTIHTLIETLTP